MPRSRSEEGARWKATRWSVGGLVSWMTGYLVDALVSVRDIPDRVVGFLEGWRAVACPYLPATLNCPDRELGSGSADLG